MGIKTNITASELMRLNKWIKSLEQAERILADVKTKPSVSLDDVVKNAVQGTTQGGR